MLAVDERAQCVFGPGNRRLGEDHRFLALRHFRFRLHDVDRRHGADFHAGAIFLQRTLREIQRLALHVEAADGEDQIPVGVLHRPGGGGDGFLHLHVGDLAVLARDLQLLAGAVDAEVAQQRLREVEREVRPGLRREVGEDVVGGGAVVLPADLVAGAAPGQGRLQPEVQGGGVVLELVDVAGQQRVDRGVAVRSLCKGREGRGPGRPGQRDADVLQLRVQPHHFEVGVLLERQFHGVGDRQPLLGGRRRRLRRGCLSVNRGYSENGQSAQGRCHCRNRRRPSNPEHVLVLQKTVRAGHRPAAA